MSSLPAPASCTACRLRRHECICAHSPRLAISTRLFVIVHSKEWRKTSNTGHLARLAIQNGVVRRHGLPRQTVSSAGVDVGSPSTLVLYPGRGAQILTHEIIASIPRPITLLVPDGNWNQTQHMMRRVPMLQLARPVQLGAGKLNLDGLRRNSDTCRMSTFEAIAQALGILEGPETESDLLRFFRHYLESGIPNSRRGARRASANSSGVNSRSIAASG